MTFVPPVDLLNSGHETLWANLGDWSATDEYPQAAEALALRLGSAAELGPGHRVLDAGCGAGDQLRVWVERFDVGCVTGIEKNQRLAHLARTRVSDWGLDSRIEVGVGDAGSRGWAERANGDDGRTSIDRILALDAAYFFGPRATFLASCHSVLRDGGLVAVTDLLLGDGASARLARRLSPLFGIPANSLLGEAGYQESLAAAGFETVRIEDCTEAVLGGFSRWIRRGGHLTKDPTGIERAGLAMTGRTAARLCRSGGLRYVSIVARRGRA